MIMHCLSMLACFSLVHFNGRWIASSFQWFPEYYWGLQSTSRHRHHFVVLQISLGHRIKSKTDDSSNFATCRPWFHFSETQTNSPSTESSSHLQTDHWSFMQNTEIIHILSSVAVLLEVQDSHSLLILFLMPISGHIQHIQRQSILNIWLMTNDTGWRASTAIQLVCQESALKGKFSPALPTDTSPEWCPEPSWGCLTCPVRGAQGTSLSMKGMSLYLLSVRAHCRTACSRMSRDRRCA